MLGAPEPIRFPVRGSATAVGQSGTECTRHGIVSFWVGNFPSINDAERYFGIPEGVNVYLPPELFMADFELGDFPPETLEVNFEQLAPRPLTILLEDASYAASFADQALAAAARQGVEQAQGIALLYNFDYRLNPKRRDAAGPLRFIGAFPYVAVSPRAPFLHLIQEIVQEIGCPMAGVLLIVEGMGYAKRERQTEPARVSTHMTAQEYCAYLLQCRGPDTPATLRELGLRRSEDVGRIVFALVKKGRFRAQESDAESDFVGLFVLD